jgi:hypothetical protein
MAGVANHRWVTFESALLAVSVEDEVDSLSENGVFVTLRHIKRVLEGSIDPVGLQIWREYRGIPLFMVEYRGELMVYAVEDIVDEDRPALKVSIMFAGVRQKGYRGYDVVWDGSDESLWRDVVEPRCHYHFVN